MKGVIKMPMMSNAEMGVSLVHIIDYDSDKEPIISSFYTNNLSDYIRTIRFCQTDNIPLVANKFSDKIKPEYVDELFWIQDIEMTIPDGDSFPCLKVYVKM